MITLRQLIDGVQGEAWLRELRHPRGHTATSRVRAGLCNLDLQNPAVNTPPMSDAQ